MVASILIILFSLALFLYWFRYTCILVLKTSPEEKFAGKIATVNRLSFPEIQERLRSNTDVLPLDALYRSLDKDYRIVCYLFEHAAGFGFRSVEQRLLALDYQLMQLWYRLARRASAAQARRALEEMSSIVSYFARKMGERATLYAES